MSVDISKLKRNKTYKDNKIMIHFSITMFDGDISSALSVYLRDGSGQNYPILHKIVPDTCRQNFDNSNQKIREFVQKKIDEWVEEEEEYKRAKEKEKQDKERTRASIIKKLMDSF